MANNTHKGNPWVAQHLAGEFEFCGNGYTRAAARRLVEGEYAGCAGPVPCECGGQAFYRATVGAHQCPSCRKLYRATGEAV